MKTTGFDFACPEPVEWAHPKERKCQAYGCSRPVTARMGIPLERGLVEVVYYCRSHAKGMEKFAGAKILEVK